MPPDTRKVHGDLENGNGNKTNGNPEANGEQMANSLRNRIAVNIQDFSFSWFTVSMNTGILSILFHQSPYQFNGLPILSTIMFVFNLIQFSFFFIILMLRIIFYFGDLWKSITTNLGELSMTAAVPIAWFTLVAQVSLTVSNAYWGGYAFTIVAFVMWWIGTAVTLFVACAVFHIFATYHVTNIKHLTPALVVPFVATSTNAVVGGILCLYSADVNARLAVPTIIMGYILNGIGLFFGLLIFACNLASMITYGTPPGAQTPGLSLLNGPPGQACAALLLLGNAAKKHFGNYNRGTFLTTQAGEIAATFGVLFGLLILGLGVVFTAFAIYMLIEAAYKKEHKYSMLWWATIFPYATITTSFIVLAGDMDSPTFRVLASILIIALVINYLVNFGFTFYHVFFTGKVLSQRLNKEGERPKAQ